MGTYLQLIVLNVLGHGRLLLGGLDLKLVNGVLVKELNEILLGAVAVVVNVLVNSGTGLAELDGGEALDTEGDGRGEVVGSGIELGNDNVRSLVGLSELLVDGGQALAVAAPGGVELNQNVLVLVVLDNLGVSGGDNDLDGAVVLLGNSFGLDRGLDSARQDILSQLLHLLNSELTLLVQGELGAGDDVLDTESGPLLLQVDVGSVGAELGGVNVSEVHLALEGLGDGLNLGAVLGALLGSGEEEVGEGETRIHVAGIVVGSDLIHGGDGVLLDELDQGLGIEGTVQDVFALIELLEKNNSGSGSDLVAGLDDTKDVVVAVDLGNALELLASLIALGEDTDDDNLVGLGEGLEGLGSEVRDWGEVLLLEVGDDGIGLTGTLVVAGGSISIPRRK